MTDTPIPLHVYTERVLLFYHPELELLSIAIFDVHRDEFNAMPAAESDRLLDSDRDKPTWARDLPAIRRTTITLFTHEPPTEVLP